MSELTTGGINFGYESPVNFIMGQVEQEIKQIQNENENRIMCEIRQQLGVYVDREELIRALQYDRNQYDKGYSDGRASAIKTGHWIESNIPNEKYICSECGGACWYYDVDKYISKSRYCPNCGAEMENV